MDIRDSVPKLGAVKPDSKCQLSIVESSLFLKCVHPADGFINNVTFTKISDHIAYYDNVLSKEECLSLCCAVDCCKSLSFWNSNGRVDIEALQFRDADTIEASLTGLVDIIWERVQIAGLLCAEINISEGEDDKPLGSQGRWNASCLNKDILFVKYPCGGSFAPHTDGNVIHSFNDRSFYSVIIFLNDISSGGGTRFYNEGALEKLKLVDSNDSGHLHWTSEDDFILCEVAAKAGRMLVFEQNLVHEGIEVIHPNVKYIIRSDVMFTRGEAICNSEADREAYKIYREAEDLAESGFIDESILLFKKAFRISPALKTVLGQG